MTSRLVVLASGSGSNLQTILDAAGETLDATVELVVVNRSGARAFERAQAHGVPAIFRPLQPFLSAARGVEGRRDYDRSLAEEILDYAPDLIVQAGWMHIFSSVFLSYFPARVVNLHPALPGAFPGAHAIDDAWEAFAAGRISATGVMVHLVPDDGVDDGPVLASRTVAIGPGDTRESLAARIHRVEHELLVPTISEYLQSR